MIKQITYSLIAILIAFFSLSQELTLRLDKTKIKTGEPLSIRLRVEHSKPLDSLFYLPQQDVFEAKSAISSTETAMLKSFPLEMLAYFSDTSYKEKNTFIWEAEYKVTAWDSAFVIIPEESIIFNDSTYYFNASSFEVISPKASATVPLYDINEEMTTIPPQPFSLLEYFLKNWWWIAPLILLILFGIVYSILKSRQPKVIKSQKSLREVTIEKIDALEDSKIYEKDLKEYYYQLSIIIREFLTQHYNEKYLEKTTLQIKTDLAKNRIEKDTIDTIIMLLNQSDMVKFAQSKPVESDIILITNKARQIVAEVAKIQIILPE